MKDLYLVINRLSKIRSSRPDELCEKGALRNFAKCACNFIKRETLAQVFPVNFANFLRTPFFTEHLWWLLL